MRLSSWPEDYSEMRVYLGSSSSSEMSVTKEETYGIARSLGAASSSRVIVNIDHSTIGLLPDKAAVEFADACAGSFVSLEVEREPLEGDGFVSYRADKFSFSQRENLFSFLLTSVVSFLLKFS